MAPKKKLPALIAKKMGGSGRTDIAQGQGGRANPFVGANADQRFARPANPSAVRGGLPIGST